MASPARKTERLPFFDTPAGYDDPVAMLLGCHRRIEKKLATLRNLGAHIAAKDVDAPASVAAQDVLRYFDTAGRYHHEDEEVDLLPLLEGRVTVEEDAHRLRTIRERLVQEHRDMERLWSRIRKALEGIADGLRRPLPATDVQAFCALYRRHLEEEEVVIIPLANRWLTPQDLAALSRAMASRRGATYPTK